MASTLLLAVVFVFDLVAFALAVAAEQRRASARIAQDTNSRYCVYESDIATGVGCCCAFIPFCEPTVCDGCNPLHVLWTSLEPWSFQSISHRLIHYMLVIFHGFCGAFEVFCLMGQP